MTDLAPAGARRLFPSDAAVLDLREVRTSLPCSVNVSRPELGFDFVFQVRYVAQVRLRDLAGAGSSLTSIFRVTPESNPEKPVYFEQKWRVPAVPDDIDGPVPLEGAIRVGEGDYRVDWLLRDRNERVCSAYWKFSARMPIKASGISPGLPPGAAAALESELEPARDLAAHDSGQLLSVTVLLNVGPAVQGAARIPPVETETLLSILRSIARDPRIGSISITAFDLDQRQIVFQQDDLRRIPFANLRKAIAALNRGAVTIGQLAEKDAEARFLVRVAAAEAEHRHPDAVIFVGPKMLADAAMTRDLLKQLGEARFPAFYLTYTPSPETNPWPDLIGSAVRYWRGREFSISQPVDLVSAWSKIMSQLAGSPARLER